MTKAQTHKPTIGGREIDATVSISHDSDKQAAAVIFHARGPGLNTEYAEGLQILIERVRTLGTIRGVEIASRPALMLPQRKRILLRGDFSDLDADAARRLIMSEAAKWGRPDGAKGSGNSTKRIKISIEWSPRGRVVIAIKQIIKTLVGGKRANA